MKKVTLISVQEWDELVKDTYGRPYSFQQQNGCKERGIYKMQVPSVYADDYEEDSIPEEVNGEEMGVSFKAWLNRDPTTPLSTDPDYAYGLELWWERNFYPRVDVIANDLHEKGLLPAGDYVINIDW